MNIKDCKKPIEKVVEFSVELAQLAPGSHEPWQYVTVNRDNRILPV